MVHKGEQPPFTENVFMKHASVVLGASSFERLAYYTITGSLTVFFVRELNMEQVFAQQMQAVFQSIVYMMPILGAFVADTYTGRFLISVISLGTGAVGAAGILTGQATDTQWLSLLSLFLLFAAPVAMVKPNLIVLGADQFNERNPEQLKQRGQFFQAQYWSTNLAAATAFLVMNQIAVEGMGVVDKSWSFTFVFALGLVFIGVSFLILSLGSTQIYAPKPTGSPLVVFFKVTKKALSKPPKKTGIFVLAGVLGLFASVIASIPSFFFDAPPLDYTLAVIIFVSCIVLIVFGQHPTWIDHVYTSAPGHFNEKDIQGARDVYRLTPYVAFAIPFWSIYNQMNTSFIAQGCQMNNHLGSMTVSSSIMPTFNSVVIILLIPVFSHGIYPCMQKMKGGKLTLTPLRRIGVGFFAGGLSMFAAAMIEYSRRAAPIMYTTCGQQEIDDFWCTASQRGTQIPELSNCYAYDPKLEGADFIPKRDINLFIQVISYGLIGLAEILTAINYYDFFYSQVPPFMRSVCQAIQMLTTSLGTMVGAVINSMCVGWLPNDLDLGHQEYMYFINMAFAWFMMIIFSVVSRGFEYKPGTSLMPGDELHHSGSRGELNSESGRSSTSTSKVKSKADQDSGSYYYTSEEEGL